MIILLLVDFIILIKFRTYNYIMCSNFFDKILSFCKNLNRNYIFTRNNLVVPLNDNINDNINETYNQNLILSIIDYQSKIRNECSICLEKDNKCIKLNCNHTFHIECIHEWFKKDLTCPICRKKQVIVDYN